MHYCITVLEAVETFEVVICQISHLNFEASVVGIRAKIQDLFLMRPFLLMNDVKGQLGVLL